MNDSLESWFSLTFTPTSILASRFNAFGSVEINKHPASLESQAHYHEALRMYGIQSTYEATDREVTTSIFRQAIAPIAEGMSVQLGHTPEYAAIFLPAVFDMDRVRAAGSALFADIDDSYVYAIQHAQSRREALEAFGFLEDSHVGPVPTERIDGYLVMESEPLVLVLEYEKDYLSIGIHSVD
jgi:hypothetical protein